MNDILTFFIENRSSVSHGLFFGLAAIGLSLVVRYLRAPDFTTLGSMMAGGIASLVAFNHSGSSALALFVGALTGVVLGCVTGLLTLKVKIPLVYAGILTYVASMSAAYLMAPSGSLDLGRNTNTLFLLFPEPAEVLVGLVFALIVAALLHYEFKTKRGKLIIAMNSSEAFLRFRHPRPGRTTMMLLLLCNGLVGFSGALFAIRDKHAAVQSGNSLSFLLVALGSIYVFEFVSHLLRRLADAAANAADANAEDTVSVLEMPWVNYIVRLTSGRFSSKYDDSKSTFVTCMGYVAFCVLLQLLYSSMTGTSITTPETGEAKDISKHLEYISTVAVIVLVLIPGTRFRSSD